MIGQTLSHFRVVEKLGEGGMGVVYKAEDVELHREVALKVLRPDFVGNERRRARFIREARTAAKVSHPNLAIIHEIGEEGGETFIAMEFVEGQTLRELAASGPLTIDSALKIAVQIADGLAAAHRTSVVHRDLKPENVVIDREGRVKILDFGLAKWLEPIESEDGEDHSDDETVSGMFTQEGRILGTVAYMSPEQARGLAVDARSDIFSFGITLYELLTGRSPFLGETPSDTLAMILREQPPPTVQWNPSVPPGLGQIVANCLEKNPEDRYASAVELLADLQHVWRSSSSGSGEGLTTEMIRASSPSSASSSSSGQLAASGELVASLLGKGRKQWLQWIAPAVIIAALFYLVPRFSDRDDNGFSGSGELVENSLAVMTFQNLQDPEDPDRLGQILQELIITDLSELTTLKVFSSQRLFDTQKQMGGADLRTFDQEVAGWIAKQVGADTMLEGSLSRLGDNWILTAQLIDVEDGTVMRSQRIDGTDIYEMVDQLTSRLHSELQVAISGEPAGASVSVREKTTSSLEAYRLYLAGCDLLNKGMNEAAAETLAVAIELDPSFGQAYYKQAMSLWWARGGDAKDSTAAEPLTKMLNNRLYASRQERIMAEAALELIHQDWDNAQELYAQVTEQYPDEKEGWYGLGEARFHSSSGSKREALQAFERAIALDPGFTLAYPHVFDVYGAYGQYREAIARAHEVISQHPENPLGYRWRVDVASHWGDRDEIEDALAAARARQPEPEEWRMVLLGAANGHRQRDDFVRARELYEEAIALAPDEYHEQAFWGLFHVLLRLGEVDAAEEMLRKLARQEPDLEEDLHAGQVAIALARGDWDVAIALTAARLEAYPEDEDALRRMGNAFIRAGRYGEAETLRSSVMGSGLSDEQKARFLRDVGWSYFDETEFARAAEWIEGADTLAPDKRREQKLERSWLLTKLGRFDEAEALLETASGREARRVDDRLAQLVLELHRDKPTEAEAVLHELLATGPYHAGLYDLMVSVLISQDRLAEAEVYARRAVEMNPSHTSLVGLAWVLIAGDIDVEEGVALARQAQNTPVHHSERPWIMPSTPSAEHCLGLAQLEEGRVADAIATLEEAARLRPDRDRIREDIDRARSLL